MKKYNPLSGLLAEYRSRVAELKQEKAKCEKEIEWHNSLSAEYFSNEISRLNAIISNLKDTIAKTSQENQGIKWVLGYIKNVYPKKELDCHLDKKAHVLSEQARYLSFDLAQKKLYLDSCNWDIGYLEAEIESLQRGEKIVDDELRDIVRRIKSEEKNLNHLKSVDEELSDFEYQLDNAENSYERKMVHEECEEKYGCGSPGQVRRKMNLFYQINVSERTLEKLYKEAWDRGRIAAIPFWCNKLVVDGSNLCFARSRDGARDAFIGLKALKLLIPELKKRRFGFVVYFDHSMLESGKITRDEIMSLHDDVRIPDFGIADPHIVNEASKSKQCFILSHDKFHDLKDSDAYGGGRVMDVKILPDEIYIKDLCISIRCRL